MFVFLCLKESPNVACTGEWGFHTAYSDKTQSFGHNHLK